MYYTVYRITNQINGKIYIGSHKTKNLNDNYMGSGKYLKYAQEKYGMENFTKEILFVFDTPEEMYAKEAEIVNEEFLVEENTYNIKLGGFGGFDYINSSGKNIYGMNGKTPNVKKNLERGRETQKEKRKDKEYLARLKEKISVAKKDLYKNGYINPFKGKTHSAESKCIIGEKSSIHQSGAGNSQFGTRWIHNIELKISKKILKDAVLPEGWLEGRKIKFELTKSSSKKSNPKPDIKKERLDIKEKIKIETGILLRDFINSDHVSLRKYCKECCNISVVALTNRFKKYIPGYIELKLQGSHNIKELLKQLINKEIVL